MTLATYSINKKYSILFPYTKKINKVIHIFLYLNNNFTNTCELIHYYYDKKWYKFNIDRLNYDILSNFSLIFNKGKPHIFYIKKTDSGSDIYTTCFDPLKRKYSKLKQITKNNKSKVYLSTIYFNDKYHICFSEKNANKYYCTYAKYSSDFNCTEYAHLSHNLRCEFPHFILENNSLKIIWREYNQILKKEII